jgi:hypothetical protein
MKIRDIHLWIGLIASILIFLEAITGLLLVHTNWLNFDKQVTTYSEHKYTDNVNVLQALDRAAQSGKFDVDEVRLVMNHTLGDGHHGKFDNYKVRLHDANQTLYVFDTKGNLMRKEVNVTNNIIRDFHYGELEGYDLSWLMDIIAISVIFLTVTGIYLGISDLIFRAKKKKL